MAKKKKHNVEMRKKQQKPARDVAKPAAKKKAFKTPGEIIDGFTEDVTTLLTHKEALKRVLKERDKMVQRLRDDRPEKFANVNLDIFTSLKEKFGPIDKGVNELNVLVGALHDAPTFAAKMELLTQHFEKLADMQYEFQELGLEMERLDRQFHQTIQEVLLPKQVEELDTPDDVDEPEVINDEQSHEDAEIDVPAETAEEIKATITPAE